MAFVIGILFMTATYLMLSKSLLRIIVGTGLLSHGAHLLILTMGGLKRGAAPIIRGEYRKLYRSAPTGFNFDSHCYQFWCYSLFLSFSLSVLSRAGH